MTVEHIALAILRKSADLMEHKAEDPACDGRTRHTLRKAVSDIREHVALFAQALTMKGQSNAG